MATNIGGVVAMLTANASGWTAGMQQAQRSAQQMASVTEGAIARAKASVGSMASAMAAAAAVGGLLVALDTGIKLAADMEQAEVAFTTMLGSAQDAKKMLGDLQQFAATTPFQFTELTKTARQMVALGYNTKTILPDLRILGDAVSGLGGGSEMLDRVVLALGQMGAKGRVSAQEMNQLAEAGIPAWKMLAEAIGVDIATAMKMAEAGAIKSADAIPAIMAGMQKKFAGGMAAQAKTLAGSFSNMLDVVKIELATFGKTLSEGLDLKGIIQSATANMKIFGDAVKYAMSYANEAIQLTAGIAAVAGVMKIASAAAWAFSVATRAAATSQAALLALSGPKGITALAVGLLAAGAAAYALDRRSQALNASMRKAAAEAKKVEEETSKAKNKLDAAASSGRSMADAMKDSAREAKLLSQTIDASVSPTQTYMQTMRDLDGLLIKGAITVGQLRSARAAAAAELDKDTIGYAAFTKSLQEQIDTFGMTTEQVEFYRLAQRGATDDQLAMANAMQSTLAGLEAEKKAREEAVKAAEKEAEEHEKIVETGRKAQEEFAERGRKLAEDMRTPAEEAARKMDELNALFQAGAIDAETMARAIRKVRDELRGAKNDGERVESIKRGSAADMAARAGFNAGRIGSIQAERARANASMAARSLAVRPNLGTFAEAERNSRANRALPVPAGVGRDAKEEILTLKKIDDKLGEMVRIDRNPQQIVVVKF